MGFFSTGKKIEEAQMALVDIGLGRATPTDWNGLRRV